MTPIRIVIPLASLLLLGTRAGWAQTECRDTALTQSSMLTCASSEARTAEHRLDALLKELSDSLGPGRFAELAGVQRIWQQYRDLHCDWSSKAVEGGSLQPTWRVQCIADLTAARVQELKWSLCDGAIDCPAAHRYDAPEQPD